LYIDITLLRADYHLRQSFKEVPLNQGVFMKNTIKMLGISGMDAAKTNFGSLHRKLQGLKIAGMLFLILVIGFSMSACDIIEDLLESDNFAGTWHANSGTPGIDDTFWSDGKGGFTDGMYFDHSNEYHWTFRGTYSISGSNLTKTYTHLSGAMIGFLALTETTDTAPEGSMAAMNAVTIEQAQFYSESQIRALGSHAFFTFAADYLGLINTANPGQSFVFNNSNQFTLTDNLSTPTSTVYTKAGAVLSIVGAWSGPVEGTPYVYTFNSNGTGTVAAMGFNFDSTWVLNGNSLTVTIGSGIASTTEVYIITLNGSTSITMLTISPNSRPAFTLTKQ